MLNRGDSAARTAAGPRLPSGPDRPRLVAVADSESYLKWAARLLDRLGDFDTRLVLMDTPILPAAAQIEAATAGTSWAGRRPAVIGRRGLAALLTELGPHIVLAAATGPVVQQIHATAARLRPRPGLVSGLPGVGLPATGKGARYRRLGDAFLTHSHREAAEYARVYAGLRLPAEILTTRLPMLESQAPPAARGGADGVRRLVFAPQAKVPVRREQREAVLRALAAWAAAAPGREAVVKLRSREGEQETHHEHVSYRELLAQLRAAGEAGPQVREGYGPMSDFLTPSSALVTVSSTAALESLDRGLPTAIISDFGVDDEMLNEAFAGSGTERTLAQIAAGDLPFASERWLEENYFHAEDGELERGLALLALRARERQLPGLRRQAAMQDLRRVRAELRTLAPAPVVRAYRAGAAAVRGLSR